MKHTAFPTATGDQENQGPLQPAAGTHTHTRVKGRYRGSTYSLSPSDTRVRLFENGVEPRPPAYLLGARPKQTKTSGQVGCSHQRNSTLLSLGCVWGMISGRVLGRTLIWCASVHARISADGGEGPLFYFLTWQAGLQYEAF